MRATWLGMIMLCVAVACSDDGEPGAAGPAGAAGSTPGATPTDDTATPDVDPSFDVRSTAVTYDERLDLFVFEQEVTGVAGSVTPTPAGQVDGAPVLGYVFPTTLRPENVGFGAVEGIVALAATSHPDFDDTPLWDEGVTGAYDDDGAVYHAHWVVLVEDDRATGGLAVLQAPPDEDHTLPPTAPMPMYLDSPGFSVVRRGSALRILVPRYRISNVRTFQYDAVTAFMEVDASGATPLLKVEDVYDVLSGDLSLPYTAGE